MDESEIMYIGDGVCAPYGFAANGLHCGLSRNPNKNDLGMILAAKRCTAAAVYTRNKVKGAPILVTKKHLQDGMAQCVVVNSTNANTCNEDGEEKAVLMCRMAAQETKISPEDVIVASTGVIGQPLNIRPIEKHMDSLVKGLSRDGSGRCATAIMTTDVRKKEYALEFSLGDRTCRIGGIAKGSGMIHPNMATMLCFLTTDVNISHAMLQKALLEVTKRTFNRVSVDGDTSTNDMCTIMASGEAENQKITKIGRDYFRFTDALFSIMARLSKEIARDGEGATKLLECTCATALNEEMATAVAKSVITSSLFKAAMFGEDANWGRILCAIGYADAQFDIHKVSVTLSSKGGSVHVCENGMGVEFSEEEAKKVLQEDEIHILIDLHIGNVASTCWGCDLSYDYVKINGDYRS